jgi:excisionase family DNA binding protein
MTQQDTNMTRDMTGQDDDMTRQDYDMTSSGHVTVEEAARLLDVSVDAVRKRIERGTLRSEKVGKTRYVLLDDVMTQQDSDRTRHDSGPDFDMTGHDTDMTALVASMQDQIDTLKRELEDRKAEARRKDAILMTMAQRIPELEATREAATEAREGHESVSEGSDKGKVPSKQQEPSQRRSWWRAFFGLE